MKAHKKGIAAERERPREKLTSVPVNTYTAVRSKSLGQRSQGRLKYDTHTLAKGEKNEAEDENNQKKK